jgi:general secretion pathway protein I
MVALAVVALAVPALLLTLNQQIDGTAYLRDRSLARLVASNRLAELRLALRAGPQNLRGRISGSESMADRDWFWSIQSQATEVPNFTRVEVQVRTTEDPEASTLYTLVAYLPGTTPDAGG